MCVHDLVIELTHIVVDRGHAIRYNTYMDNGVVHPVIPTGPGCPKGRWVMAIQTRYTKAGHTFECEVTPEFAAAYEATIAAYPVLAYPIEYGIKQSTSDAYAGKTLHNEIEGAGRKKWDAIMAGTVRVAGSAERVPTKTPMEREVWRIASGELSDIFTKKKVPKDRQAAYTKMLVTRDWERLEEMARTNLAKADSIKADAFDDLDELLADDESDEDESDETDES